MQKPPDPRTSAAVAAEIADQNQIRRAAVADLDRLAAARPAMLLDLSKGADAALDAHDAAMARQRRAIERADALSAQLGPELDRLQAEEDAAARAALYARGQAAASEVADLILNDYGEAVARVVDVLHRINAANALVLQANAALPAGARAIDAEGFRSDRGVGYPRLNPLWSTIALPAALASDGALWPPERPAYDVAAERLQRQQTRDVRDARQSAEQVRTAQNPEAPKAVRSVMATDAFGLPAITVTQPDMEAWHRDRDAREARERAEQAPKPRAPSWAGI